MQQAVLSWKDKEGKKKETWNWRKQSIKHIAFYYVGELSL